ncbi:MAG: acyl-CoA thioesterase [Halobacteria archaeon]
MTDERYSYRVEIDVRFRDLDYMKHVNNAVYATYLEHARANYFVDVMGESIESLDFMVATLELDYLKPIKYDENVYVHTSVTNVGDTSMTMEYVIEADGKTAAEAKTVLVAVDGDKPSHVPEKWRDRIEEFE